MTGTVIESRIHMFSVLAEAAEIEHNLMCLYLYAMFALKRSTAEGVSTEELEAIDRWRKVMMGVCLEEMSHLALVSNLTSSLGGTAHFTRPNFPVSPGPYPADFIVELAPFDLKTLDHFIFLERPITQPVADGESFKSSADYHRVAPRGRLMPNSGDYETVGELYEEIRKALIFLSKSLGEKELFCGNISRQITPIDSPLPGLIAIQDLASALKGIDTIVIQGEGAKSIEGSHFQRFCDIKNEYLKLLELNPQFEPGRRVARNPVMRQPPVAKGLVWVTHPIAARYMDLANAFYSFMLRVLVQVYLIEDRNREEKHELLEMAFSIMHMMAVIGETLTLLPSSEDTPEVFAGMSFAMVRTLTPFSKQNELDILLERLGTYDDVLRSLQSEIEREEKSRPLLNACVRHLHVAQEGMARLRARASKMKAARDGTKLTEGESTSTNAPESAVDCDVAVSDQIEIQFDAKKCIHTRHCVTELPNVFKANTPGAWLFPANSEPDVLAAVIRECPSGALTYRSKGALKNETAPDVNVMRLYENGPYAFVSDLEIDGKNAGYRATLCRCGQSKCKPYCDHSHVEAGFLATGEPATQQDAPLPARGGKLKVERAENGPLLIKGNVEICAATGRVVLRTSGVALCRCGHSKTKPVCDGTHAIIGFKDSRKGDAREQK